MAWTYGFFNSVDGDRTYNAQQISEMFDGLITEGVFESVGNKLAVQPNDGMTIQINTGRGFVGKHWVKNDSIYTYTLEASDVLLNRYCAVCIRADDNDSVRNAVPYFKYSEFATNPVKPTMVRTEKITERCLAYIYIKAKATTITAADIEDTRGNTNLCGWVTGLIDQVDTTTLWEQYKAEWNTFMDDNEAEIEAVTEAKNAANTAATNATTQANYAKTQGDNAKTQASNAQTQATAAETAATNANTQATNAQTQAAAAQTAAERAERAAENAEVTDIGEVNTRIDNLRPGVTNLFLNSTDYSGDMWFKDGIQLDGSTYNGTKIYKCSSAWAGYEYLIKNLVERNLIKLGDVLTCSCYAKTDNPTEIRLNFFQPPRGSRVGTLTSDWQRFSCTFTVTEDIMAATSVARGNSFHFEPVASCDSGCYVYITNLILTKGNMIVDWSPAPEDSISAISELNEQIEPIPGHNFLDNSNFAIWQESTTYTKTAGQALARHTADRWENHATESGAVTIKQGNGMAIENSGSDYVILRQILDNCSFLHGKTVTFSFSLNGTVHSHTFENLPEGFLLKYEGGTWTVTSDTSDNIQISITGNVVINWVKLELGATPTQYIPPNYAAELEKCRFYYCPLTIRRTPYCQHTEGENTISDFQIDFGRNMRTAPTITGMVEIYYQDGNSLINTVEPQTYIVQNDHAIFQYLVPINTYITATLVLDARRN